MLHQAYDPRMAIPTKSKRQNTVILSEYNQGRLDERTAIENKIREVGYDWSHDADKTGNSALQRLLNWMATRE